MADRVFYVEAQDENGLAGYVPAKFLVRNGAYVMNPTPAGSQQSFVYSDARGNGQTKGVAANPNNYLMVPVNYTEDKARDFANGIASALGGIYPEDETGSMGPNQAREQMTAAFRQGGSQDLQRHPQWGVPNGSAVPAFAGAASNHLGYVSAMAGVPMMWPEVAGGAVNWTNGNVVQPVRRLVGRRATTIDTSGPYGLSKQNHDNIAQGYSDGLAASRAPASFNDYGGSPQAGQDVGKIGDGNGVGGGLLGLINNQIKPWWMSP